MLETRFLRIPGDMGNTMSRDFPVYCKVVRGDPRQLIDLLVEAGRELVAMGVGCDHHELWFSVANPG